MYSNKYFLSTYFKATFILFILIGISVVTSESENPHVSSAMFMGYLFIFIVIIGVIGFFAIEKYIFQNGKKKPLTN